MLSSASSTSNKNSVDILFLDVEMPGASGFDLLDQLAYYPKVILTTSKSEYAYNAFEYNVTDFSKSRLPINVFRKRWTSSPPLPAINNISSTATDHIFIKCDGKLVRLNNDDILFIESMGDYVKLNTPDKKYITHNTIKTSKKR